MENSSEKNNGLEIDIFKLLRVALKFWWLIVLLALIGGVCSYAYTDYVVIPTYKAGATLYVNNSSRPTNEDSISTGDLNTSARLVATYSGIISSDSVLESVANSCTYDVSAEQIRGMMSVAQVNETEIFQVFITCPDPQMASDIANTIADVAPAKIEAIVQGCSTRVIDYAKVPTAPNSPNLRKNVTIGIAAGIFISLIVVFIAFVSDVRIKSDEDLSAISEFPVLGRIPDFSGIKESKSHSDSQGYSSKEKEA